MNKTYIYNNIKLIIKEQSLVIKVKDKLYYATYYFADYDLREVEKEFYDLLMYVLFYGLEDIELKPKYLSLSNNTLASYSGGVDSTALISAFSGIPIHIERSFNSWYDNNQIKAVKEINGHIIKSNFEQIRENYGMKHGFNIGMGYGCLLIPLLPILKANKLSFGIIFDDLAFNYSTPFRYNKDFTLSRICKVKEMLNLYGIDIILPLAGYSEVLSVDITDSSHISNYSSCHTQEYTKKCLSCYKCFRKEGIRGNKIDLDNPKIYNSILSILKKKPLKMASSTIYAIQKAGYKGSWFDRYRDIDVSFCTRVNRPFTNQFYNGTKLNKYEWQTSEDIKAIELFVNKINSDELYI